MLDISQLLYHNHMYRTTQDLNTINYWYNVLPRDSLSEASYSLAEVRRPNTLYILVISLQKGWVALSLATPRKLHVIIMTLVIMKEVNWCSVWNKTASLCFLCHFLFLMKFLYQIFKGIHLEVDNIGLLMDDQPIPFFGEKPFINVSI